MKLVTQDYGCGTSSSIFDYGIEDVIIVSPNNFEHIFEVNDDLFFVGHDFLFFLWDSPEKVQRWKNFKYLKIVWCFERIDAIVPIWQQKSHYSMQMIRQFADQIFVCDEDDCEKYGFDWFPQWGSCKFFEKKQNVPEINKILFSGQAGIPEYAYRNEFVNQILQDKDLANSLNVTNTSRTLSWDQYIDNLLNHTAILNPVGILKGFNTRAYEVMYSGRMLLQHTYGNYKNHFNMIKDCKNVVHFSDVKGLKKQLSNLDLSVKDSSGFYNKNNIYARFKSIGVDLK